MELLITIVVTFFAGMGAGLGTGFAGMSAAAVISPMLITFLGIDPYMAVGIALSSDVLASAVSAYTYGKNKNLDIKNGLIMMASVLLFTVVGSYISSLVPSTTMGNFSVFMTFLLGIKFIVKPVMTTKESMQAISAKKRAIQSTICGVLIGFICGFIGAGGGMMMLLILTSVLGYELKTAVGTSVFIMAFTAFTGAVSHFVIGGAPDWIICISCVVFTLLWARIAALFANKAEPKTLNRVTGIVLVILGVAVFMFSVLAKRNTEIPLTIIEDNQESSQGSDEVLRNQNIDIVPQDKLTYSNLDSELSMSEVRDILAKAGIQTNYVDTVMGWVTDYNNSMRECPSFSLVGDFITLDEMTVDYGEYYPMSTQWYKRNNRNYHDVVCRTVAYELSQDNISVGKVIKEENFDCWDENIAWLYTDGDILFGREAVEGEHKAYVPYPLIDWSKDMQAEYFTLYNPIHIKEQCSEQEMFQAIQEKWNEQEISFKESAFSLITFWTQRGDRICASHAATLIETDNGYLLFEKTNPESPYAATKFSSTDEVKQYLYNMMNLDYSRYNDQIGTYIILQNDKLL